VTRARCEKLLAAAVAAWLVAAYACAPAVTPAETAAASYAAQQNACVDKFTTRAAIDACRDEVKRAWATNDAGSVLPFHVVPTIAEGGR
jgi:hypothetical protein